MKRRFFRCVLLAVSLYWLMPEASVNAQSVTSKVGPPQKKEQITRTVINRNGKVSDTIIVVSEGDEKARVKKGMILMADSIYQNSGNDMKNKTVTVIVSDDNEKGAKSSSFTYSVGDTAQNDLERNVVRLKDGKQRIIMQGGLGNSFDPSDPSIVSYKKKDMGKGLEKITIVRKKVAK
jgi:hypothetical protein